MGQSGQATEYTLWQMKELMSSGNHIFNLVDGDLTTNGIQWNSGIVTVDADTKYTVFESGLIKSGSKGILKTLELGLTHRQKAGSATADVKYVWSISPNGIDWTTLFTEVTIADINTTYIEYTYSGYVDLSGASITDPEIYLKLEIESNETTPGVSTAAVKNSSYGKMTFIGD